MQFGTFNPAQDWESAESLETCFPWGILGTSFFVLFPSHPITWSRVTVKPFWLQSRLRYSFRNKKAKKVLSVLKKWVRSLQKPSAWRESFLNCKCPRHECFILYFLVLWALVLKISSFLMAFYFSLISIHHYIPNWSQIILQFIQGEKTSLERWKTNEVVTCPSILFLLQISQILNPILKARAFSTSNTQEF